MKRFLQTLALGFAVIATVVPATAQIYVNVAPPAPVYETRPANPGRAWTWVPGYYRWNGSRYVWVKGHYAHPPHAGGVWIAGHWGQGPRGRWFWHPGHWRY